MSISNLTRRFAIDQAKAEAGVTVDLGGGIKFTVARLFNKRYAAAVERLREPFKALVEAGGKIPDADQRRINARAMAEGLLIGWEGVVDDETGEPIPYSPDAAAAILEDEENATIRDIIFGKAREDDLFRKYSAASAEKNSAS